MRHPQLLFVLALSLLACRERQTAAPTDTSKTVDAGNANTSGELLIGEFGSLTGSEATFGTSTRDGIELAIRQAKIGLSGHSELASAALNG